MALRTMQEANLHVMITKSQDFRENFGNCTGFRASVKMSYDVPSTGVSLMETLRSDTVRT